MRPNSAKIHMDFYTVEYGKECNDCLRWYVPLSEFDEPCPHCKRFGQPKYPNRVRYLAVKQGMSLRGLCKKAKLQWRTVRLVSQGKIAPHLSTKKKILKALGRSIRDNELSYVFPHPRRST